jgi:DNA (cytosine-5)-methyltransferase 1
LLFELQEPLPAIADPPELRLATLDEPAQTIPATAGGNRTHIVDETGVFVEYHRHLRLGGAP